MRRHFRTSRKAPAGLPSNRICAGTLRAPAPRSRQAFFGAEETGRLDQKVTGGSPIRRSVGSITAVYATGKEAVVTRFDHRICPFRPEKHGTERQLQNRPALLIIGFVEAAHS